MAARQEQTGNFIGAVESFRECHSAVTPMSDWFEIADPQDPNGPVMISISLRTVPIDFLALRVSTRGEQYEHAVLPDDRPFIIETGLNIDSQGHVIEIEGKNPKKVAQMWCVLGGVRCVVDYIRDPQDPMVAIIAGIARQNIIHDEYGTHTSTSPLLTMEEARVGRALLENRIPEKFNVPDRIWQILTDPSLTAQDIKRLFARPAASQPQAPQPTI